MNVMSHRRSWSFLALGGLALAVPAHAAVPVDSIPAQLSVGSMFAAADWVVKLVIIGLLVASLVTWTVLVAKTLEFRKLSAAQKAVNAAILRAPSLAEARASAGGAVEMLEAASQELQLSAGALDDRDGLRERIATRFARMEAEAGRKLVRGVHVLATIGATAPFVGLFGTVWGIMNSFIGIAENQTTNLAVVAPGIAEALLATGVGLFAAIPAVVIYNHFSRQAAEQRALTADRSAAILNLVSRDLSRGIAGTGA